MHLIFTDTETTGLNRPEAANEKLQPFITEICAIKCKFDGGDFKIIDEFNSLVRPPIPLPPKITEITGITDEMLENEPTFIEIYKPLAKFFLGTQVIVAHNLAFDAKVIEQELARYDLVTHFPWPPTWHCTIELSMPINSKRMRLGDLYKMATGKKLENAHRARNDVVGMIECYKFLWENGFIEDIFND